MVATHRSPRLRRAASLVALSVTLQEGGAALAVGLFSMVGAAGAVFLRFAAASVILVVLVRPRVRGLTRSQWSGVAILALSLASMNFCFYQAISRAPLGVVVTIEILGPLSLSVLTTRRPVVWLWAALSLSGVVGLGISRCNGPIAAAGLLFAVTSACAWICYILAARRAAMLLAPREALTLATCLGACALLPAAAATADLGAALHLDVLGLAMLVAVVCSVAPYGLELSALRVLPAGTFAMLTSLSPVIAAVAGWSLLGQTLSPIDWASIVCVTLATAGAVRSAARRLDTAAEPHTTRPRRGDGPESDVRCVADRVSTSADRSAQ